MTPQDRLRYHVTDAIERGEADPIIERPAARTYQFPDGPMTARQLWLAWWRMEDVRPADGPGSPAMADYAALCADIYMAARLAESVRGPVYRFGDRVEPVVWEYEAEYSAAPGRWPLRVSCVATGPLAAVRKMRRAFPPEPGTRLVRLTWNRHAPLVRCDAATERIGG